MSYLPSKEKRSSESLIRAKHNRRINHELKLVKEAIAQTPSSGQLVISVPRKDDQPTREATLTICYASFTFLASSNRPKSTTKKEIILNVISAREENPPTGKKPINWLLLTTLDVQTFEQAVRCIRWYTYRWLIERYHYVLKSGCRIEHLQLETAERIKKALAKRCHCCLAITLALEPSRDKILSCLAMQS